MRCMLCLVTQLGPTLFNPMDCCQPGSSAHGDSPGKNTGVGCHALLQGIFPTQGSNSGLLHCRWILYKLSHKGSPRVLEWVVYPLSFSTMDAPIFSRQGLSFLHILISICFLWSFLMIAIQTGVEVFFHCDSDFHFSD